MKPFFLENVFVINVIYPFLVICLVLGVISIILITLYYVVCKLEEIKEKEKSVNDTFFNIKKMYKKQLEILEGITKELMEYSNLYGEHDAQIIKQVESEKFSNRKKLDAIDKYGTTPHSIKGILEISSIIDFSIRRYLSITSKYPDIKSYTKFLTQYSEFKGIESDLDTIICLYNRKVKEFNSFIISFPYLLFALFLKKEPRNTIQF
ncbi:MAG: hypothetical protein A2Y25_07255 [Candidatus Melainabacteria bacterium GWF2_37_15]|nr:MAG: hypothetical protein A2Y25_07255 [Candidatus Melainabacteria bacterium GWF2_37_15]